MLTGSFTLSTNSLETIVELSQYQNICGLKEASGNIPFLKTLKEHVPHHFSMLSGDDISCMDFLIHGGEGVISVASHILPQQFINWYKMIKGGDKEAVTQEYLKYEDLLNLLYIESNPIPIKGALYIMGLIKSPELRSPLVPLEESNCIVLKNIIDHLGLSRNVH